MRAPFPSLAVLLCGILPLCSQPRPAFEVSSVKPHQGEIPAAGGKTTLSGNRLTISTYSPLGLIFFAYDVKAYQIANPSILDHTFYDITGAAAEGVSLTRDDARLMMQSLLADRFKLQAHWEERDTPVYALVVGKGGPKFKESAPGADAKWNISNDAPNVRTELPKVTLDTLADFIRSNADLDRPVIDATGFAGSYAITINFTREQNMPHAGDTAISVFTAVQQQLGLKLEPRTAPVRMLVIDHIGKPAPN